MYLVLCMVGMVFNVILLGLNYGIVYVVGVCLYVLYGWMNVMFLLEVIVYNSGLVNGKVVNELIVKCYV